MKRLETIASLVTKDANLIDIGTDHAYLPIYLYKNNITHHITASDVSKKVLETSKKNIQDAGLDGKIKVLLSDGFLNTEDTYDEAVIAGMGTDTIIKILEYKNIPNTLIISTHNNLEKLRKFMQDIGYKIVVEKVVLENKKYYDIIKYQKGSEKLSEVELMLGKSNDKNYLMFLKNKYQEIYKKSNDSKYLKYINAIEKILDY